MHSQPHSGPQTRPKRTTSPNLEAHPMAGRPLKYCICFCRFTSVLLAPLFLALCAVPLGFSALMVAILGAVGCSVAWNFSTMMHCGFTGRYPSWQLILVMDIMILPSILIIFGVISKTNGLNDFTTDPQAQTKELIGFVMLITMGVLHVLSFILSSGLMSLGGVKHFGLSKPAPTLTSAPRAPIVTTLAGTAPLDQNMAMDVLARPREAFQKQRADGLTRPSSVNSSQVSLLPLYTRHDPTKPPPYAAFV